MHDPLTRVKLVKARVRTLQRNQEKREILGLIAVSSVLFLCLAGMLGAATEPGRTAMRGLYSSMLLRQDVGGYVLVGVIAFVVAVVVTVFSMRYNERAKRERRPGRDDAESKQPEDPLEP